MCSIICGFLAIFLKEIYQFPYPVLPHPKLFETSLPVSVMIPYQYRFSPNDIFFACSVNVNGNGADEDYYYPNCPVWERRKMFMKDQPKGDKIRDC